MNKYFCVKIWYFTKILLMPNCRHENIWYQVPKHGQEKFKIVDWLASWLVGWLFWYFLQHVKFCWVILY